MIHDLISSEMKSLQRWFKLKMPNGTEPKMQDLEMKEHFHQIIEIHH